MRKLILVLAAGLALGGCTTQGQQAAVGAGVGGLVGAGIGQAVGGNTASTLIGAGIGATAGALIAANNAPAYAPPPPPPPAGKCAYWDDYNRVWVIDWCR